MEEYKTRSDIQLIHKAILGGWITTNEKRVEIRQRLEDIISDPNSNGRLITTAIKTLASLEQNWLSELDLDIKRKKLESGQTEDDDIVKLCEAIIAKRQGGTEKTNS